MRAHVEACLPMEACGLLAGNNDLVEDVITVPNEAQSPTRFFMSPKEQMHAFDLIETKGMELVGIFHSHPDQSGIKRGSAPEPSSTDVAESTYPVIQVVWSRTETDWDARGFWIEDGRVSEVLLNIRSGN
jgi:proteasome lid subunit RPN8/RPN11